MMTNETELEQLKKLIVERFVAVDQRFDKVDEKFKDIDKELENIRTGIAILKVDTTWIKWLFGGLLSFVLILLSIILTVLFKLLP